MWANFIVYILNTKIHITRFVKLPKCNKNAMYVIMTEIVYTYYAVNIRRIFLSKLIEPSVWPPKARTWTWLTTLHWGLCSREHIALRFPAWKISNTECAPAGIIDKPIDYWRDKLKAVVWLNGEHTEQLFWLSGSFVAVLLCSVCILTTCVLPLCIERYDGIVTKSTYSK